MCVVHAAPPLTVKMEIISFDSKSFRCLWLFWCLYIFCFHLISHSDGWVWQTICLLWMRWVLNAREYGCVYNLQGLALVWFALFALLCVNAWVNERKSQNASNELCQPKRRRNCWRRRVVSGAEYVNMNMNRSKYYSNDILVSRGHILCVTQWRVWAFKQLPIIIFMVYMAGEYKQTSHSETEENSLRKYLFMNGKEHSFSSSPIPWPLRNLRRTKNWAISMHVTRKYYYK